MSSADFTIHTPGIGTLLYGLISSGENSVHFLQLMPFTVFLVFVPPVTHHCWVDRGGMVWEVFAQHLPCEQTLPSQLSTSQLTMFAGSKWGPSKRHFTAPLQQQLINQQQMVLTAMIVSCETWSWVPVSSYFAHMDSNCKMHGSCSKPDTKYALHNIRPWITNRWWIMNWEGGVKVQWGSCSFFIFITYSVHNSEIRPQKLWYNGILSLVAL